MAAKSNDVHKVNDMITVYWENKQETKIFSNEAFHYFDAGYITKYNYLAIQFSNVSESLYIQKCSE